jgi:hypothetical protein
MKRPYTKNRATKTTPDVTKTLSKQQFLALGKVAHFYNYCEVAIDRMFGPMVGIVPTMRREVVARINGIEGKIELIKIGAANLKLPEDIRLFLAVSLGDGGFMKLKHFRDAVVHARVVHIQRGIGERTERRGRHFEVLLTSKALNGLARHLVEMAYELDGLMHVGLYGRAVANAPRGPKAKQFERAFQDGFAQAQLRRTRRLSLPPLPEFPTEPEEIQAENATAIHGAKAG